MRQHGGNHLAALGLGLKNGLEVVLFRNVDRIFHGLAGDQFNRWQSMSNDRLPVFAERCAVEDER